MFSKKLIKVLTFIFVLSLALIISGCDHFHSYVSEVVEPTCDEEGYTLFTCSCGHSYKGDYIDPAHKFGEWEVVTPGTNGNPDIQQATCEVCGETIQQEVEHEHEFIEVLVPPTCTESGLKGTYCECGVEHLVEVPALNHDYQETVISPSCKEEGYTVHTCTRCNDSYIDSYKAKLEHQYKEQVFTPTCEEQGYTLYTCSECGDSYKDNYVKATGHKYAADIILPSCKEEGYTLYTCDCGHSYQDNFTEKTEHNYGEWEIVNNATATTDGLKKKVCCCCGDELTEVIPATGVPSEITIQYDLDGGFLPGSYKTINELANAFISDYNKYSNTTATIANFSNDSTQSVKVAFSNSEMLSKWKWLFEYMYNDLVRYNKQIGTSSVGYVSDSLDLLPLMINGDTTVIKDSTKGPNFRTLIRGYLHGVMNSCKGGQNVTFAAYCPDFSDYDAGLALLAYQFAGNFNVTTGSTIPTPIKDNYIFSHWLDSNGNVVTTYTKAGTYKAIWDEGVKVENIQITNKTNEINLFDTYQLEWLITPQDAVNKLVSFTSSNESVLTIDRNGLITTHEVGTVTITIKSMALGGKTDSFTVSVITPGYFDISYETNSYVLISEYIKLNAIYINPLNQQETVIWETMTPDIAGVDSIGNVTGVSEGLATIRAYSKDRKQYQDFIVTVLGNELSEALQLVLDSHESNIFTRYDLGIGAGTPVYDADILGSVSKLLYNKELEIDTTYSQATEDKYGAELQNRLLESVEFITVHYTGGMTKGSTAKATAAYFAKPLSQVNTSIHYCTGNDGIYKGLSEIYRAAHAGDDGSLNTVSKFEWLDTPVTVKPNDPEIPVVSITKNATFSINGEDTGIKVPYKDQRGNEGYVTDDKWLNKMDLAVNIKDGKYQLGTAWWCYTQVWEGRICSNGGNRNSIGIESAVNEGSDLWLTWQITAMLVADIMERYDLDITRVKGHHFFSAKDCPQPMLENDLEIWYEFLELVKSEHAKLQLNNLKLEFETDSEYLNNYGRVVKQSNESQVVSYTVTITHNGKTETITLASIIEGNYVK